MMQRMMLGLLLLMSAMAASAVSHHPWYNQTQQSVDIYLDLFMSTSCSHCTKADKFVNQLEKETPWLRVNRYYINKNKQALIAYQQRIKSLFLEEDYSVPAFFFCEVKWTGFDSAETTGKQLKQALNYCHQKIKKNSLLTPLTIEALNRMSPNPFQAASTNDQSPLIITTSTAVFDAFNPCSTFAFALFIAFLFVFPSRNQKVIVGLTMITLISLLHFIQQVNNETYYLFLSWSRGLALLMGLVLVGLSLCYRKFKPEVVYVLAGLSVIVVYSYQQTCILFNFSIPYQQWLMNQDFTAGQLFFYQLLYQLFYILPLVLIWIFVLYFLTGQRAEGIRSRLLTMARLLFLAIGLFLMVYPRGLSDFYLSIVTFLPLVILGWLMGKALSDDRGV